MTDTAIHFVRSGAIEKYNARVEKADSLLCVSLDPEIGRLSPLLRNKRLAQLTFNKHVIDATHEFVSAFKATLAFYETRGSRGFEELKMTVDYIKRQHPDILLIGDGKRGDIAHSNAQYAAALYDEFDFDAVTLHPYLGKESLMPFLERKDKGCIILARSSNPGARELQDLIVNDKPLWHVVAEKVVKEWNENGNCMLVAGATYLEELKIIRRLAGDMPLLVPGVGAQGGDVQGAVEAGVDSKGKGLIMVAGRSIIFAEDPAMAAKSLRDEINRSRHIVLG